MKEPKNIIILVLFVLLLISCADIDEDEVRLINSMNPPVIVISTNEAAGFTTRVLLIRDSTGRVGQLQGLIFNSLQKGDTIK